MRTIDIVNLSTVLSSDQVNTAVAAISEQIARHYEPAGYPGAKLRVSTHFWADGEFILILDDTVQAGALGFHTLAKSSQEPIGFVFARTAIGAGSPWSGVLSHEVLEQIADPWIDLAAIGVWEGKPSAIAWETCDAVEATGYKIDGVAVSNFVLPAWFRQREGPRMPVDFLGQLQEPCTLLPGGYIGVSYDLTTWQVVEPAPGLTTEYRATMVQEPFSRLARRARKLVV